MDYIVNTYAILKILLNCDNFAFPVSGERKKQFLKSDKKSEDRKKLTSHRI
jgi:hypothetical protein